MSAPMEPFESQDVNDDDGAVIDSFLIETDSPPDMREATQPIVIRELPDPIRTTRLISGEQLMSPTFEAALILPADANRKSLNLYVYSPTGITTDGIRFADDKGMLSTGGKLLHSGNIDMIGHTGPLYAIPTGSNNIASAAVTLQYWSVTF